MPKPVQKAATKIAKPKPPSSNDATRHPAATAQTAGAKGMELPAKAHRELALKAAKARWNQAQSAATRGQK